MFGSILSLDRERTIKYGMKAISLIEKKFKKPITSIDHGNLTMEDTAYFIWAGMQHEDAELTPTKLMDLIDEHITLKEAFAAMEAAIIESFGKADEAEGKND